MPRTVRSKVRIELSAQQAWQLRNHFGLEKHIATLHMRALTLREENVRDEGTEDEQRHRVVHCELVGDNHVGANVVGIRSADLSSDIVTSFFVHRFDEAHGSDFRVEMAMKRLNVSIAGHQWCLPETETSCTLCTTVEVHVRMPGIGGLVEMQLERRMRASHADFPKHGIEYLRTHAADAAPSATAAAARRRRRRPNAWRRWVPWSARPRSRPSAGDGSRGRSWSAARLASCSGRDGTPCSGGSARAPITPRRCAWAGGTRGCCSRVAARARC